MSLYGLHIRNPSMDSVFLLQIEKIYIGAVQQMVNYDFSKKI